jgi:hypothetical protein
MRRARRFGILVGCAIAAAVAPARATDAASAARAEKLFYEGLDALSRHDYDHARENFEASVALVPRGSALRNLATVDWALGRHVEALKHSRAALQTPDLAADMRERARRDVDAAYAATGHIAVNTDPGATVTVDGVRMELTAPLIEPVDVEPGVRGVQARLGDRIGYSDVEAKPGVVVSANVFVSPQAVQPSSSATGSTATASGPERERPREAVLTSASFWNTRRVVGAAAASAGAVSLGVGVFFFAGALSQENRVSSAAAGLGPSSCSGPSPSAACATLSDAMSAQRTDAVASRVLLTVGAVGAVAGAAMLLWPSSAPSHTVAVVPVVSSVGNGIRVEGSF